MKITHHSTEMPLTTDQMFYSLRSSSFFEEWKLFLSSVVKTISVGCGRKTKVFTWKTKFHHRSINCELLSTYTHQTSFRRHQNWTKVARAARREWKKINEIKIGIKTTPATAASMAKRNTEAKNRRRKRRYQFQKSLMKASTMFSNAEGTLINFQGYWSCCCGPIKETFPQQ